MVTKNSARVSKNHNGARNRSSDSGRLLEILTLLGERVRRERATRGMTRRVLARDSGVSERYLAQLESGQGNPSVAVLLSIAEAMGVDYAELVSDSPAASPEVAEIVVTLKALAPDDVDQVRRYMAKAFELEADSDRGRRIALIGLRGAGKSTLGRRLADRLNVPFIELNRLVEQEYGASIGEMLALSGQPAFRRYERRCLEAVLAQHDRAVIATGGGVVANDGTFSLLLSRCHTIWLKARPEEHMERVLAQGDLRPMARNKEAMADLKSILRAREGAYGRAMAAVDTGGRELDRSIEDLIEAASRILPG